MTLVMHLCSACNRRTINFYDDDDDDESTCAVVFCAHTHTRAHRIPSLILY